MKKLSEFEEALLANMPPRTDGTEDEPEVVEDIVEDGTESQLEEDEVNDDEIEDDNVVDPTLEVEDEVEDVTETEDEADSGDNDFEDWDVLDEEDETEEGETSTEIDYSAIAIDFGMEASDKDDLVSKISSIKDENAQLKADLLEAQSQTDVVTDNADYENVPAKEFFIEASKELFTDENGTLDAEGLKDFIEDQDPNMVNVQGKIIKGQYLQAQAAQRANEAAQAEATRLKADNNLKSAIKEFDTFNGFKVNENHKAELYNDISSGKALQEMFYTKDGEYDMDKVIQAVFYYKKGKDMEKFRAQRAKNAAMREVIDNSTNADLRSNGRTADPGKPNSKNLDPLSVWGKELGMPGFED